MLTPFPYNRQNVTIQSIKGQGGTPAATEPTLQKTRKSVWLFSQVVEFLQTHGPQISNVYKFARLFSNCNP